MKITRKSILSPLFFLPALLFLLSQCTPKKDAAPGQVASLERFRLSPRTQSVGVGGIATYTAQYTNTSSEVTNLVPDLVVVNSNIATITEANKVKGLAAGSTLIISSYKGISDTVSLTVVQDSSTLANLYLTPRDTVELRKSESVNLAIEGRDLLGRVITSPLVNFSSTVPTIGNVVTSGQTRFVASEWGTTKLTATSGNVVSTPLEIAVIRKGSFQGTEGHFGSGTVVTKMKNGQLIIRFESDFTCQSVPDARVYLSNTATGNQVDDNGIEIALLRSFRGRQSYLVPASVRISDYPYCVVYCKQFSQGVLTTPIN
jgi:hypothetical protein